MRRNTLFVLAGLLFLVPVLIVGQQAVEHVDLNVIHKIKTAELGGETGGGFGGGGRGPSSQVMNLIYNLTDRYGPRLTNSPQFRAAGDWAVAQLKEWGLSNVNLEKWPTERLRGGSIPSWQFTRYTGAMVEPSYMPIIGYPQAWTAGTNGVLTGEATLAPIQAPGDLEKFRGKLKGKIVLTSPVVDMPFPTKPLGARYSDAELAAMVPELLPGAGGRAGRMTQEERQAFNERQRTFMAEEGVLHDRLPRGPPVKAVRYLLRTAHRARAMSRRTCLRFRSRRKITTALRDSWSTACR